jgi:hypothetical protein
MPPKERGRIQRVPFDDIGFDGYHCSIDLIE